MTEEHMGEQKSTKEKTRVALHDAISLVNGKIDAIEKCLRDIASTENASLVTVDGSTSTNFNASVWVDPKEIAKIMLRYNYQCWQVLGWDAPDEMWDEIAEYAGLDTARFVDMLIYPAVEETINTKND